MIKSKNAFFVCLIASGFLRGLDAPVDQDALDQGTFEYIKEDFNSSIEAAFQDISQEKRELRIKTLITGAAATGALIATDKMLERYQTRDPFSFIALVGPQAIRLGVTSGVALWTAFCLSKGWRAIRHSFESPFVQEIKRLEHDHQEFKETLEKHQDAYEEVTDKLIEKRLQRAEESLKDMLKSWFEHIEETHGQAIAALKQQERGFSELKQKLTPAQQQELDALLAYNAQVVDKLEALPAARNTIVDKYGHKQTNPVKKFLSKLFTHKKS
jgi:hypothetical protein